MNPIRFRFLLLLPGILIGSGSFAQKITQYEDPGADINQWHLRELFLRENLSPNTANLNQLISIAPVLQDPKALKERLGLGVQDSFSNPAGILNSEIVPVFPTNAGVPVSSGSMGLGKELRNATLSMAGSIQNPVDRAFAMSEIRDGSRQCGDAQTGSIPSSLPAILPLDETASEPRAVIELKPDPKQPDLWTASGEWSIVDTKTAQAGEVRVLNAAQAAKKQFSVDRYQVIGTSLPSGFQYSSEKTTQKGTLVQTSARVSLENIGNSSFVFRASPRSGSAKNSLQYLLIARPFSESLIAGAAIRDSEGGSTFLGYEAQSMDHVGHLIIQTNHDSSPGVGKGQTVGLIARLGSSSEVTGTYQWRTGGLIASAAVTPVRMGDSGDLKTASSNLQAGLQLSDYRVSAFVNLALVKNWATDSGMSGEVSSGLFFKNSGTSVYMVVPIHTNPMPRVQLAVPLDQKRRRR